MARARVRKFGNILELETFLNGGLIIGELPAAGIYGLVGKTLKFVQPSAVTVTFGVSSGVGGSAEPGVGVNPDPQILFLKDIKLQIEAAIPAVQVRTARSQLLLIETTPTNGITLDNTGTASPLFGHDDTGTTAGQLYASPPSTTPPVWTFVAVDSSSAFVVFTFE